MTLDLSPKEIRDEIERIAFELGFDAIGFSDVNLKEHEIKLQNWLDKGFHGDMEYMQRHGTKRSRPEELIEGTCTVISVRMNYLPEDQSISEEVLKKPDIAYISRYALGRDYHKLMRKRLKNLAQQMQSFLGEFGYRVFTDSAPVLEKALAEKSGLGWIGKHSNLIQKQTGSWFFLGEIYTNLELTNSKKSNNHCGSCQKCLDICPTQAIVAPYQVDARKCISYLTIELKTSIPIEFREAIGNRIYGCDDCQLVCPWNKFAQLTNEPDFKARNDLDYKTLIELFEWDEETFLINTEGSAIRRIGYECWQRNIAVALGNSKKSESVINALRKQRKTSSKMLKEHIDWALDKLNGQSSFDSI